MVGCTFVDWSIHWLSGAEQYYWTKIGEEYKPGEIGWYDVADNPMTSNNAHSHYKNHPHGSKENQKCIDSLKGLNTDRITSFYPVTEHFDRLAEQLGYDLVDVRGNVAKYWDSLKSAQAKDYSEIWDQCRSNGVPIIYVRFTEPLLYNQIDRVLGFRGLFTEENEDTSRKQYLINNFFHHDIKKWKNQNPWDIREVLALNLRPWQYTPVETQVDFTVPHFCIDAQDLWYNGQNAMERILNYLELPMDQQRLEQWLPVYRQWQQMQFLHLSYCWNFDDIINCIINNRPHDLSRYNLTLVKEALIQHELIYKHGLTLKSWGLGKFPDNTQDLHSLLEPNVYHSVENLYNLL